MRNLHKDVVIDVNAVNITDNLDSGRNSRSSIGTALKATGVIAGSAVLGATIIGGLSAGLQAAYSSVGHAILHAAGWRSVGFTGAQMAQAGAVGGAIVGGSIGALIGPCVISLMRSNDTTSNSVGTSFGGGSIIMAALTNMAGGAIVIGAKEGAALGYTAASGAIGSVVTGVGIGVSAVVLTCIGGCVYLCCCGDSSNRLNYVETSLGQNDAGDLTIRIDDSNPKAYTSNELQKLHPNANIHLPNDVKDLMIQAQSNVVINTNSLKSAPSKPESLSSSPRLNKLGIYSTGINAKAEPPQDQVTVEEAADHAARMV